jgi:hypothetical protein
MAIEVYALESATLRADKLAKRGGSLAAVAKDIVQVFGADSVDRLTHAAKNALITIAGADAAPMLARVQAMLQNAPVDTIAARRRIADAVIDADRYPL